MQSQTKHVTTWPPVLAHACWVDALIWNASACKVLRLSSRTEHLSIKDQ